MNGSSFAGRFAEASSKCGPAVFGLDPSGGLLRAWGLSDDTDSLEQFTDIVLRAAVGAVGVVKPQSAFFERHGWRGLRVLNRLIDEARSAGVLVLLDAKRGDVGSTNEAYAEAYLGSDASMRVDALTVTPYLGLGAMQSFLDRAAMGNAGLFVVVRSSNPEGRSVQAACLPGGRSVEQQLIMDLAVENARETPGGIGPFGAVFGPTHEAPTEFDLRSMGGLFLAPGVGKQGATMADVATCFAACPDRVLPSASRSLLAAGPDVARLRYAVESFANEAREILTV